MCGRVRAELRPELVSEATYPEHISLVEMNTTTEWDSLAALDYTDAAKIAKMQKTQKWTANPITKTENVEHFMRYLSTCVKANLQELEKLFRNHCKICSVARFLSVA